MGFLVVRSSSLDPVRNLSLEEALLLAEAPVSRILFLYVNDPCLVVGRNQNPWIEVAPEASRELPLLRRVSGGGTVYQDRGNLNWALILPRASHDPAAEIAELAAALLGLGVEASSGPRGGLYLSAEGPLRGRKISGTARRMSSSRVLHHGTLLVRADLERMNRSLGGLTPASSRALSSVPAQAANLADLVPGLALETVADCLARRLSEAGPGPVPILDAEREIERLSPPGRIEEIAARHRSWEWLYGQSPCFSIRIQTTRGELEVELREGRVAALKGPAALALGESERNASLGLAFDYHLPEKLALLYE